MRTYKLTISYDGTRYQGWQRQRGVEQTIQHVIEQSIASITGYEVKIQGSGRTDGGVHALGQVASLRLSGKVEEREFLRKLNERISVSGKSSWYRIPFMDAEAQRESVMNIILIYGKSRVSFQENIHITTRRSWISRQ